MNDELYNEYLKSIEETEPNYHSELMAFYDKMFDKDNFCYVIERNKIGVDFEDSLISYEISTSRGKVFHMRIFEGEKLIDEAFFYKNPETEDYDEVI